MGDDERVMSFTEHLEELRSRLIKCILGIVIATMVGFAVTSYVLSFLIYPLDQSREKTDPLKLVIQQDGSLMVGEPFPKDLIEKKNPSLNKIEFFDSRTSRTFTVGSDPKSELYYFNPTEPFMLKIKAALIIGLLLSLPIIVSQAWKFVAPGLTKKERKYVKPLGMMAIVLFPIGAMFAFFCMQFALKFLAKFAFPGYTYWPNAIEYINFLLTMMLIMGVVFELPLVLLFLAAVGVVSSSTLRKNRHFAILIIMIIAMIATPPDPFTMLAMGIPLTILYEISIWLATPLEKKRQKEEAEEDTSDDVSP